MTIVGLLLAAGGARRFGAQKLVQPLDGAPLVRHAATLLASSTDALVVVVGHDADAVRAALAGIPCDFVENTDWRNGLSSSLRRGVESLSAEAGAILVALGDQPRVDASVIDRVIDRWRETGRPIVSARYRGVRGHPVLFDRSVFAELAGVEGDAGAKTLIERSPERVAYVDVDSAMPRDVDSPADLAALDGAPSPGNAGRGNVGPHQPT